MYFPVFPKYSLYNFEPSLTSNLWLTVLLNNLTQLFQQTSPYFAFGQLWSVSPLSLPNCKRDDKFKRTPQQYPALCAYHNNGGIIWCAQLWHVECNVWPFYQADMWAVCITYHMPQAGHTLTHGKGKGQQLKGLPQRQFSDSTLPHDWLHALLALCTLGMGLFVVCNRNSQLIAVWLRSLWVFGLL